MRAARSRGCLGPRANTESTSFHVTRVGPTTPTRPPRLPVAPYRLDRLPCCRIFFAAQRPSPSARGRVHPADSHRDRLRRVGGIRVRIGVGEPFNRPALRLRAPGRSRVARRLGNPQLIPRPARSVRSFPARRRRHQGLGIFVWFAMTASSDGPDGSTGSGPLPSKSRAMAFAVPSSAPSGELWPTVTPGSTRAGAWRRAGGGTAPRR